jgi:hypothetical protein
VGQRRLDVQAELLRTAVVRRQEGGVQAFAQGLPHEEPQGNGSGANQNIRASRILRNRSFWISGVNFTNILRAALPVDPKSIKRY